MTDFTDPGPDGSTYDHEWMNGDACFVVYKREDGPGHTCTGRPLQLCGMHHEKFVVEHPDYSPILGRRVVDRSRLHRTLEAAEQHAEELGL